MLERLILAVAIFIIAGLCLVLLGAILLTVAIPQVVVVGDWLKWAWVLALAFALLSFVSGTTWGSLWNRL